MTLKYANGFEYKRVNTVDSLYRVGLNDAQAVYRNGNLKFEYYVKDHLGNVRVVFDETGKIIQKSDFYPFGLEINKDNPVTSQASRNTTNRYLYNGKELQEGSGYVDFGARMYMPEIGRWGVSDPLAEKYYSFSPYIYSINDPVLFGDLDGRDIDVSRFKSKQELNVLRYFLATELGRAFFRQFARKNDVVGGVRFLQDGARVKDLLVIQSVDNHPNMPEILGLTETFERKDPSNNSAHPGSIYGKALQSADEKTNVSNGIIFLVRVETNQPEAGILHTLSHESFVHVQEDVKRLNELKNNPNIKPGSYQYIQAIQLTGAAERVDHQRLGRGLATEFKNIAAQLDKLNNTSMFSTQYNEDVQNNRPKK